MLNSTVRRRASRIQCLCVVSESVEQLANSYPKTVSPMVLDIGPADDNLYEEGLKLTQMSDDMQNQPVVAVTAVQGRARNACLIKFRRTDVDSAAVV